MIFAQILNSIIVNIIVLDDASQASVFAQGYDACLEIDQLNTIPSIGWFYDIVSGNFFPPATLALIQNNSVINIIQNCDAYITNQASNYQYIIDITIMNPQPQVGWTYNGTTFTPSLAYYQDLISQATAFGFELINNFAAVNASMGITQAGQTGAVIAYTSNLYLAMTTGSLYEAITIINGMIADTSQTKTSLAPFITNDILYSYLNQIQDWLEIPETPNPGP
jgi:hypothetical protein